MDITQRKVARWFDVVTDNDTTANLPTDLSTKPADAIFVGDAETFSWWAEMADATRTCDVYWYGWLSQDGKGVLLGKTTGVQAVVQSGTGTYQTPLRYIDMSGCTYIKAYPRNISTAGTVTIKGVPC